jgi:hypothetical protein
MYGLLDEWIECWHFEWTVVWMDGLLCGRIGACVDWSHAGWLDEWLSGCVNG